MAPVGHDCAHSSHATQRVKSMTGKENDDCVWHGAASVRIPVFKLLAMIRNMIVLCGFSAIVSRIGKVEALVDHGKVRNDVARRGLDDPGPVQKTRVGDF